MSPLPRFRADDDARPSGPCIACEVWHGIQGDILQSLTLGLHNGLGDAGLHARTNGLLQGALRRAVAEVEQRPVLGRYIEHASKTHTPRASRTEWPWDTASTSCEEGWYTLNRGFDSAGLPPRAVAWMGRV